MQTGHSISGVEIWQGGLRQVGALVTGDNKPFLCQLEYRDPLLG